MKTLKAYIFILSGILFFGSCNVYKSPVYGELNSPKELSSTYVDMHDRISLFFNLGADQSDIYEFDFKDSKTLDVSRLTPKGMELVKTYKGTHKKKQKYFQITLENRVIPLLIFNDIARDLLKIGHDENKQLLLERNRSRTTSVLFIMFNEILNANSQIVNIYDEMTHFPFQEDNKWGYADKENNMIIEPKYDFVRTFERDANVARYQLNNRWGYISKSGEEITPPEYEIIERFDSLNYARVYKDSRIGLIDRNGVTILPPLYDYIAHSEHSTSISICRLNNKLGIVVFDKLIYEPVFDNIKNIRTKTANYPKISPTIQDYLCEVKIGKQSYYADKNGYLYPTKDKNFDNKIYYKDILSNPIKNE